MKFFIIQENIALEYTFETRRWLGFLNENMIAGDEPFIFDNGSKYIGTWRDGKMHGKGICIYLNKNIYEGEFVNGAAEGEGTLYASNYVYQGEFRGNLFHGQGTIRYTYDSCYVGQWTAGKRCGFGTKTRNNITVYKGYWLNDNKHGSGTEYSANGEKYIGEWSHGIKQGRGILVNSSGKEIKGKWIEYEQETESGIKLIREFVKDSALFKTKIVLPKAFQ